jgi:hypothetical protein
LRLGARSSATTSWGALIDRLLHHGHLVNICGNSYRVRYQRELAPTAEPTAAATTPKRGARRQEA